MDNCFSYLFGWLWTEQPGVILVLTCGISGLLHAGYIVDSSVYGGVYKDAIDSDTSANKRAIVNNDVSRAINFDAHYQDIPILEWIINRQGRDIVWAHYHHGTRLSAYWTTMTMIVVTVLFWKKWSNGTWTGYFKLLAGGIPSFIKMILSRGD